MKVRVGRARGDGGFFYWLAPLEDPLGGQTVIEITGQEYTHYKRVMAEYDAWQKQLTVFYQRHNKAKETK